MSNVEKNMMKPVDFNPFEGNVIEKVVPSTESQKEIFASCLLGEADANLAYNLSMSLHFTGNLDRNVLKECIDDLIVRHESLRSSFSEDGDKMIIYENQPVQLHYEDIENLNDAKQQEILNAYLRDDAASVFDIVNGPLIRFALFKLASDKHVFTITVHHLICDGWSLSILLEDLSKLYNEKLYGDYSLPKASAFSDYAINSLLFESTDEYRRIVNYWKKEYEESIPVFEIPPDFPRPPVRTYKGRRDDFILPLHVANELKQTGAKYRSSFVNILMTAFEVLLFKYTGHNDIVIGLPTAGQAATETYDLVGHCVNLLPLKSSPDPDITFAEYLRNRKSKTLRDYEHQRFTFGTFLKELKIQRDPSRMPLAPVSLNIDIGMNLQVDFKGLDYKLVHNKRLSETYELFLNIADNELGYEFQWSYNTQLYKPLTIKGLMDKYSYLLTQIIENPEQKIADLRLQDQKSLTAYWEKWNNQDKVQFGVETILEQINKSCLDNAHKPALYYKGISYSYKDVYERSNQMAHYLILQGVKHGTVIGIAMERSANLIIAILGAIKAGAVFVPLDPQYAQERIEYMLENSGAELLLTSSVFKGKLKTQVKEICVEDVEAQVTTLSKSSPEIKITGSSLVYILYTSGSTGKPKGVMIANKSLVNYISWAIGYYLKGKSAVFPLYTSISFDLTITSIFSPLISGSLLKIYEEEEPVRMLEKIFTDKDINVVKLTPSHLKLMKDSSVISKNLTSQHLTLIVGGEELETSLAKEIYELYNGNIVICNEYGPTEATVGCMIYNYDPSDKSLTVPIGVPISNARIYLLDSSLSMVPSGIIGEIYIGGDCVAVGYYNNEALTHQRFLNDPFVSGGRMYKTGDNAVMLENGNIVFKGRIDDQVKLRGYRIELGEIDYHISGLSDIKNVITIVREDQIGDQRLVSYIILNNTRDKNYINELKEKWREALRNKLPDYMIPSVFMVLEELPLTANGKVDRKKLPIPEAEQQQYVEPRTEEEVILAEIWSDVFAKEQIGVNDNFFELGGHSLLAVRVIRILEKRTGIDLPMTLIFRHPVLRDLAVEYAAIKEVESNSDDQKEDQDKLYLEAAERSVLSFVATEPQQEIWQECIIGGTNANISYNVTHTEYQEGELDIEVLKQSIRYLMNRHELLCATFSKDGIMIHLHPEAALPFYYEDISAKDSEQQQLFIESFLQKQQEKPFDLAKDLLFRINVLKLGSKQYLFNLVIHHLICDGDSFDIVIKELGHIYNAYKLGKVPELDEVIKFSAYAEREQKRYQSSTYKKDLGYWISKFENNIPVLNLPVDYPYPSTKTYKSNISYFPLTKEDTVNAEHLASRYNSTTTIFLRAVFDILIYKYTGQEDFVVGLPVSDHISMAGHSMVGHSVNMLPVRTKIETTLSFRDFLKQRNDVMINDYEHQHVTFGSIIKNIKIQRRSAKNTLVSISFGSQMGRFTESLNLAGIKHRPVIQQECYESLELLIDTFKEAGELKFQVIYKSALFKPSTIAGLMEKYIYMLREVCKNPELPIADIKLAEENIILDKLENWNQTFKLLPEASVIDLFETAVYQNPDYIALKFRSESYSYKILNESVNRHANYLIGRGVKKGDTIGIVLERNQQVIVALLAVLKCGATYLPIDPEFPEDRIKFMLEDSEATFVLINKSFSDSLGTSASKHIIIEDVSAEIQAADKSDPGVKAAGNDLAYLLYTSGSTGKPKGVMVSHRNLLNLLLGVRSILKTDVDTRLLSVTTVSFDIAALELFLPVISGGYLVLADTTTAKNGEKILEILKNENINLMQATPVTYKMMLEAGWNTKLPLRIISGGEALTKNLAEKLLDRVETVYNMYGPTETTIYSTATQVFKNDDPITIGKPIQNTQVYILDENKNVLAPGQEGEIYIGGEGVSKGYHNRPELTKEKFIANPFDKQGNARIYRTGDRGKYMPDGNIVCLGRTDTQAKIRGYRIELEEIEHYISKIEGIKDAVVKVEGADSQEPRLIGYVVPSDETMLNGGEVTKNEIISWRRELGKSLPDYMIPNGWVKLKEFPLTPNKKVDRKALKYRGAGASKIETTEQLTGGLATIVNKIKDIWEEEIGIKGIEPDDDFFELGGHSMIAIKVMTRIEKETGARLPISALFENATIKSLAEVIHSHKNIDYAKVVIPIKPTGDKKPIFIVHAGGLNVMLYKSLSQHLDDDQPLYGLQGLGMDGDMTHLENIESIAKRYLSEVLEYEAEGPYIIMGYSFGGIIAFEIAKQLLAMGKEIKMLGILDTDAFITDNYKSKLKLYTVKGLRQFKKIAFYTKQLITAPQDFFKYQWIYLKKRFNKDYTDPGIINLEIFDYEKDVIWAYQKAYFDYKLQPINAEIDLFKTDQKQVYFMNVDSEYYGWRKYTFKSVKQHIVPGDHFTMLSHPYNIDLSRTIQKVINNKD